MSTFRKILVATDLGETSEAALRTAFALARRLGARVVALHVVEPPYEPQHWFVPHEKEAAILRDLFQREQEEARARLKQQVARLFDGHDAAAPELSVVAGLPADMIVEVAAREEADLVVVGTHGRRGVAHALLGSIAERVARSSPVPVLVARAEARGA